MKINNDKADLIKGIYSLTPLQEGMLYHSLSDSESSSYVLQTVYHIKGVMKEAILKKALELLERKYDVLRTTILHEKISKPRQVVLKNREIEYEKIDLANLSESEQNTKILEIAKLDVKRGFNLQKDTLMRMKYIVLDDKSSKLIWSMYHIIVDGWCMSILFRDFMRFYDSLKSGIGMSEMERIVEEQKRESAEYGEYIKWLEKQDWEEGLAYWNGLLSDYDQVAQIKPLRNPEPVEDQVSEVNIIISGRTSERLLQIAAANNATVNNVVEAAWGVVLQSYNKVNDVVFGKVVSGRNAEIKGIDKIVGLFINTIPFRVKCEETATVAMLLKELKQQGIDGSSYDYCSLAEIQGQTRQKSDLIKTLFIFENYYVVEDNIDNLKKDLQVEYESAREQTNYALSVYVYMKDKRLNCNILYNPNEYVKTEIEMILERLEKVLLQMVEDPEMKVSDIDVITERERELILHNFNDTATEYPKDKTVVDLFEEQVRKTPDQIAVVFEEEQLTYQELNRKANQMARKLRKLGVKPDDFVVILAERSLEMIVGIYGIMKAGGAYVPIDPSYPADRITYMLEDCSPKVLLVYNADAEIKTEVPVIDLKDSKVYEGTSTNPKKVNKPSDLLYCIYTSGTTGKPKGTMLKHSNINNYCLDNVHNIYGKVIPEKYSRIVSVTTISFDIFVTEAILPLLHGMTMFLTNKEEQNNQKELSGLIQRYDVQVIQTTPSKFKMYLLEKEELGYLKNLKVIILGGEKVPVELYHEIRNYTAAKIYDVYGPTETTVWSTIYEIMEVTDQISIGKPLANTQIYIRNNNRLCGIGMPGELCIAGDGVARGYYKQPKLTSKKFIDNPYGEGKLYRTGDLARWLPDGNIEYLGRMDEQVKIRGFRIELVEIESVIRKLDKVQDVAVIAREDDNEDMAINAYIVSEEEISITEIRETLGKFLPEYMIPAYILQIEKIPVTRNGKLDKRALPKIEAKSEKEYLAPRNETEEKIVRLFEEILGAERVGVRDSFFDLGGHSLKATRAINRIEVETGVRLPLKAMFANPTVEGLGSLVMRDAGQDYAPIPKAEEKEYYPMSSTQKRSFILNQLEANGTAYNMPHNMRLRGEVRKEAIRDAIQALINRHEILRTDFLMIEGEPVQKIKEHVEADFEYLEDSETSEEELIAVFEKPFDLGKAPLVRVKLVKREDYYLLFIDMHHIVGDGMSMGTFIQEFSSLYNKEKLKDLTHQYKDYSEWMITRDLSGQKEYWVNEFKDEIPVLDMPFDFRRPQEQSFQGTMNFRSTGKELGEKLKKLAGRIGTTEYMVFLSAAMVTLSKYSRQEDIVIGSPISGRTHKDTESMLGMFVNTLAMRGHPEGKKSYEDFLKEIKESCLKAYENQEYPFEELVEEVEIKRDMSRNPLFDVMLVLQNNEKSKYSFHKLEIENIEQSSGIAKFDLTFYISELEGSFDIGLEYCTDLFLAESAQRILTHYVRILEQIVQHSDAKISELKVLTEEERELVIHTFNDTATAYPKDKTVVDLLEEKARKTPEHIALVFEDEMLSYKELNRKANQLARKLRSLGVKPDDFVAIMTERSFEMIVGIYGIIKAGGAYVPIDPTNPQDRIKYILEDCAPKALLVYKYKTKIETQIPIINLADSKVWEGASTNLKIINQPKDLAYCIYTSGTSGKPKGSLIEHKSILRLVKNTNYIELNETSIMIQTGSMSFDASTLEVWGTLLNGGKLILTADDVITNSQALREHLKRYKVNTMWLTSSLYNQMIQTDQEIFDGLKYLLIGGEKLSEEHVRILKNRKTSVKLINGYGPTENTTFTTTYEIPEGFNKLPIGKPIANTKVFIQNDNQLCGIGIPGELCTVGEGVARGYLNHPELTAEKFVLNPYGEGNMYRTGDLARWLPDGNIEYLGRFDEQVKIRGYRIELGEIENVLRKIDKIKDVAVIAREDDNKDKAIYAYLVSEEELSVTEIRDTLGKSLPEYMIPAYILQIEKLPVTRNGKLDKRALPKIEAKSEKEYIAPRNETEEKIARVFEEILRVEKVGVKDSFYELGGDSIKAIRIVSKIREAGYDISVKDIMRKYTVEAIADSAVTATIGNYEQSEVTGTVITPMIEIFEAWELRKPQHFNQAIMRKVDTEDENKVKTVLHALVRHHDVLRSVYRNKALEILSISESKKYDFTVFDFRNQTALGEKIETECTRLQSSINLEYGPLMKAGFFKTDTGNYMMLCLHHLVVDGVSWRILIEDFDAALRQLKDNKNILLPTKTASFKDWGEALAEYKHSSILKSEKDYWKKVTSEMITARIDESDEGKESGYRNINISISNEQTQDLVLKAGIAFHTEINDLLLSALGMAVNRLTGQEKVCIGLEGHGREEIHKKIDIDRTVGWFTSIYPILVECTQNISDSVIATKEMLRKVPNHGMGFGLLKDDFGELNASLYFNYLGELDAENQESYDVSYSCGICVAEENRMPGAITMNGSIQQGQLSFAITYDRSRHSDQTMEKFALLYKNSLSEITSYCASQKETILTVSDYSAKKMSMADFSILNNYFSNKEEDISDIYSLTPLQEGMLYHSLVDIQSSSYVLQSVYSIKGEIKEAIIIEALELLARKYDVLRTVILHENISKPRQVVIKNREVEYEKVDLSNLSEDEQKDKISKLAKLDVKRGFNLQKDTLMRMKYIVLNSKSSKLVWSMHHIIVDGWCMSILFGDFIRFYDSLSSGKSMSEMERIIEEQKRETAEYGEYIKWLEKQDKEEGLSYWNGLLSDYEQVTPIKPMRKPEPVEGQVEQVKVSISKEISERLLQIAAANNVTVNNVLEAAWGVLLQRYNNSKDVVFGKVVSGRNAEIKGIDHIVGLFINTIPFRVRCEETMTIPMLLQEMKQQGIDGNSYDYCSLAEIQSQTRQKSDLIKTLFVFENYYTNEEGLDSGKNALQVEYESAREQTNYAVSIYAYMKEKQLNCNILYNPNEYVKADIEIILERLEKVLLKMVDSPEMKVSEIDIITEKERDLILHTFNDTTAEYRKKMTVEDLFEEQARKTPDQIAIVFEDQELTYKELNRKANQLAKKLRRLGVKPDDFVAILAERSIEMIVGIYGIMKAGGAYVPIDPSYPADRINYMLEDCVPKALLIYKAEAIIKSGTITEIQVIDLGDSKLFEGATTDLKKVNKPDDLLYCIYTSGTTGKPKGTMLMHRNINNYCIEDEHNIYGKIIRTDIQRIISVTTISFDIFVTEAILPLLHGMTLILTNKEEQNNQSKLSELVQKYDVQVIQTTPSKFKMYLLEKEELQYLKNLKVIILGGEKVPVELYKEIRDYTAAKIYDVYGPTETTVWSTIYEIMEVTDQIPIGKPLANTQIYIQNHNRLCGIGIPGELCIAGDGVARGYFNQPDLTTEKFIHNPYGEGKLYRTGDLARWLPDGNIEYLGRMDEQVKIRGFRIELEEIESVIRKLDKVKDVAVTVREDDQGDKAINAYILSEEEISVTGIRDMLGKSLPEYMIPAYITRIEKIPVTRNGKLDKRALPKIEAKSGREYIPPRNETEEIICQVFSKILNVPQVGVNDNFFELGGHSLLAIRFEVEMAKNEYDFKVKDLFQQKTVCNIANYIKYGDDVNKTSDIELKNTSIKGMYNKEPEKTVITENSLQLGYIEPFNDVFYKRCMYNALFPAFKYYKKNVLCILINDALTYVYNEEMQALDVEYIECTPIEDILANEGIVILKKEICDDVIETIIEGLQKERPVVLQIDTYYSPLRNDTYQTLHWLHLMLVFGYDLETKTFHVIEHSHRDNLSYTKKSISFEDLKNAYVGGIQNFGSTESTYFELVSVKENELNKLPKEKLQQLQQETLISNIISKKDELLSGLEKMKQFYEVYSDISNDENRLKQKVNSYVVAMNHIINAKEVEKYRIEHVFGIYTSYYKKINEIAELWKEVRLYLVKYMYSGIYNAKTFEHSFDHLQRIMQKEKEYIELFI